MNPIYARLGGLLNPSPWPARVACESTSLSGSRAEIRPDSSLIVLCRSDRSQAQNLTVFRSRATRQLQALWLLEGVLEISLPPSIHLSLSRSHCVTLTLPTLAAASAALASLAFDRFLSVASLFVSSRTLTRPDHTLLATSIVQHGKSWGCAAIERT